MKTGLLIGLVLLQLSAAADPVDTSSVTLQRTAQNSATMTAQLAQNVYIQVPYQDNYTVSVPEQVQQPYQVQQTTQQLQRVCHTVNTVQQQCHPEQVCNHAADIMTVLALPQPGQGPHPGPGIQPGPGPLPHPVPGPGPQPGQPPVKVDPPVCTTQQVCTNVNVPTQQCDMEMVPVTTWVTEYRTVTVYHDETRCCVTKYRSQYDHQDILQAQVIFPADASLVSGEVEQISLQMVSLTDVSISFDSTVFGYAIASQSIQNGIAQFVLKTVPKYGDADIGLSSIQKMNLNVEGTSSSLSFTDTGLRDRVATSYQWQIVDQDSNEVVAQGSAAATTSGDVQVAIPVDLNIERDYAANIQVSRTGVVLAGPMSFTAQVIHTKEILNAATLSDPAQISINSITLENGEYLLHWQDSAPEFEEVQTSYEVKVEHHAGFLGLGWRTIGDKTFAQTPNSVASYTNDMQKDLGVTDDNKASFLTSGTQVRVTIIVTRTSAVLNGGTPVTFQQQQMVDVP